MKILMLLTLMIVLCAYAIVSPILDKRDSDIMATNAYKLGVLDGMFGERVKYTLKLPLTDAEVFTTATRVRKKKCPWKWTEEKQKPAKKETDDLRDYD